MPALQVRDCPNSLYRELARCAEEDRRSISQQILVALEDYLERRARDKQINAMLDEHFPLPPKPWEPGYRAYMDSEVARKERIQRRREVFARIDARPPIKDVEGFPTAEEIVRQIRDER